MTALLAILSVAAGVTEREAVAEIRSKAGRRVEGVELPFSSD